MRSWEHHVIGAVKLLQLRGEKLFEQDISMRLFLQLREEVVRQVKATTFGCNLLTQKLEDHSLSPTRNGLARTNQQLIESFARFGRK
jgi:hypothetical protein